MLFCFYLCVHGVHMFVCAGVHIAVYAGVHMSLCAAVHMFVYSGVHKSVCAGVHMFVCAGVHKSVCAGVHKSVYAGVHMSLCAAVHMFVYSGVHMFVCAGVHAHACEFLRSILGIFSKLLPTFVSGNRIDWLGWSARELQGSICFYLCPPQQATENATTPAWLFVWFWGSNSFPYAFRAGTLPTEPSPNHNYALLSDHIDFKVVFQL
jgi:hypothetical protein